MGFSSCDHNKHRKAHEFFIVALTGARAETGNCSRRDRALHGEADCTLREKSLLATVTGTGTGTVTATATATGDDHT